MRAPGCDILAQHLRGVIALAGVGLCRFGNDGLEFRDTFGAVNEKRQDFAERVNIDQRRRLATGHSLGRGIAWGQTQGSQRSEEHTSELQSLMRISYAVFC